MPEQTLILILTFILMFLGLCGSVLPGLPGAPLILLGALLYAWVTGFTAVTWPVLLGLLILTLLSYVLEFLASVLGVKKWGGSRWGMTGAFLGGIIGLLAGGFGGVLVGPFLGAFFLELIKTEDPKKSLKSGFGSLVGFLVGAVGKVILAVMMIGIFLMKIIA
jgi:uncharacterized protein